MSGKHTNILLGVYFERLGRDTQYSSPFVASVHLKQIELVSRDC